MKCVMYNVALAVVPCYNGDIKKCAIRGMAAVIMANDSLSNAKNKKNDEFYTIFDYIQKEMNAYLEYDPDVFRGKTGI